MKITFKEEPQPTPPVTSVVELTSLERAMFVKELQNLPSWSKQKQPVLHKVWTSLKLLESV